MNFRVILLPLISDYFNSMKKSFVLFTLLVTAALATPFQVKAQGTTALQILGMPGYPALPQDTAYEGQVYTFNLLVYNGTNATVNTTLEILLKVDSIETVINTNPQPVLPPGDTLTITVTGYGFTQPQYKIGNNIVVVWPRVTGAPALLVDSFYTDVHFVPLSGMADDTGHESGIMVLPNPVKDELGYLTGDNGKPECVRIRTVTGSLVYEQKQPDKQKIPTGFLKPGVYFLELTFGGRNHVIRFVKE